MDTADIGGDCAKPWSLFAIQTTAEGRGIPVSSAAGPNLRAPRDRMMHRRTTPASAMTRLPTGMMPIAHGGSFAATAKEVSTLAKSGHSAIGSLQRTAGRDRPSATGGFIYFDQVKRR
jgi:hypothetical protein